MRPHKRLHRRIVDTASPRMRWRRTNPALAEFVAGTTIVTMAELKLLGVRKSNIVWR